MNPYKFPVSLSVMAALFVLGACSSAGRTVGGDVDALADARPTEIAGDGAGLDAEPMDLQGSDQFGESVADVGPTEVGSDLDEYDGQPAEVEETELAGETVEEVVGHCGDDVCLATEGENCESCPTDCGCAGCGEECISSACLFKACEGRTCGNDGCGGTCGQCGEESKCDEAGHCVKVAVCGDGSCEAEEDCQMCPADCGDCCGNGLCQGDLGETCDSCLADCGCTCGEECISGACLVTACEGKTCGNDGCGGTCGVCGEGSYCSEFGFCDLEGTWTDPKSKLTWMLKFDYDSLSNAMQKCLGMDPYWPVLVGLGGGWRIPTIGELRTLVRSCPATESEGTCNVHEDNCVQWDCKDASCWEACPQDQGPDNGCYWPDVFQDECTNIYWSSELVADVLNSIWVLDFRRGRVTALLDEIGGQDGYGASFRCVRDAIQ